MRKKCMLVGALMFVVAISAAAQSEAPKGEITGDYSYFRFNPTLPTSGQNQNLNGGGFDLTYFITPMIGVKADLQFYGSAGINFQLATPFVTPRGAFTVPAGVYHASGSMQTYTFGPVVKARYKHFEPFGQILFGVGHTNTYAQLSKTVAAAPGATLPIQPSQTPFTMVVGGGVDLPIRHNIAVRAADFDYVLTRITNPLTSTNNQNNWRYGAGVQFRFGGAK